MQAAYQDHAYGGYNQGVGCRAMFLLQHGMHVATMLTWMKRSTSESMQDNAFAALPWVATLDGTSTHINIHPRVPLNAYRSQTRQSARV